MNRNLPPLETILTGFERRTTHALSNPDLDKTHRDALLNQLVDAACLAYQIGQEELGDHLLHPVIVEGLPPQPSLDMAHDPNIAA